MATKKNNSKTATFERCAELRQRAGLDLDELMRRVGDKPAKSSYQRLERGQAIRAYNAFRIADAINAEHRSKGLPGFVVEDEVKFV